MRYGVFVNCFLVEIYRNRDLRLAAEEAIRRKGYLYDFWRNIRIEGEDLGRVMELVR